MAAAAAAADTAAPAAAGVGADAPPPLGANLISTFEANAARYGDRPLLHAKREGAWRAWSWAAVAAEVRALAAALRALGVGQGDRVVLVAENRPEWCVADLAILRCGAVTVPSYTTYTTEDYAYLLEHSGAVAVVLAGGAMAARLLPAVRAAPAVRAVVALDGGVDPGAAGDGRAVLSYGEALVLGREAPPAGAGLAAPPEATACIIYTSGTGGRPKGVMLSHANVLANVRGLWDLLRRHAPGEPSFLSFLPLSHAYEHTAGQFLPLGIGGRIWYAEGVEQLASNLAELRPQVVLCVPRLFEVFRQRTLAAVGRQGRWRARLFEAAVALGTRRYHARGRLPPHLVPLDRLLDRLVRRSVRERFGGRLAAMVCGGGPLNPEVGIFFAALGIPVCHGYGQTETSPVVSVTPPGSRRLETVGPPLPGVEVRVAPDGEVLVRGDLVMKGYWRDPEATAAAVEGGWLKTGDVGEIDAEGHLKITDRKKDIIVLSGGDNVAPQRVEAALQLEPELAQAIVYGDRRAYLVALLVPTPATVREAAAEAGLPADDPALAGRPELLRRLEGAARRANARLAGLERVRRWGVRLEPFTVENGLMTPTLKLRRPAIYREHARTFDGLYGPARDGAGI